MKRSNLRYIVPLSIVATLGLVITAKAAFSGPPCSNPQSCNVPGVIWNVSGSPSSQPNAQMNFGDPTTGNNFPPGSINYLSDVGLKNGRALRVDGVGATSLNAGNWGSGQQPFTFNVYGDMKLNSFAPGGAGRKGQMDADWYCISGANCINAWPSGGGGGTLTGITAGTGATVSGGAPSPTINVTDLYVNTTGDTMNGNLTMSNAYVNTTNLGGYGSYGWGVIGAYGRGYGAVGKGISGYAGADVTNGYAGHFDAQSAAGTSYGIYSRGASSGAAGLFVNAGTTLSVELANSLGNAIAVSGPSSFTGNVQVNGKLTVANPNQMCLGLSGGVPDCRSSWPTGTPSGANTQIQYNNAGAFGGSSNLTYDNANTRMTIYKTLNVNIPGTYLGNLLTEEGIKSYNSVNLADGYAHCAGDFRSVAGPTVWLGCRQMAGYYNNGTTNVTLADGTYAISAIGTSSLQRTNVNGGVYVSGGVGGYYFNDRTSAPQWALYANAGEARLWNGNTGDQFNFHDNGIFVAQGDIMTNGKLSGYTGTDSYGNVTLTNNVSPTTQSNVIMQKSGGIGFDGNRDNTGFLQLWTDNNFYWDLGSANQLYLRASGGATRFQFDASTGNAYKSSGASGWLAYSDKRLKDIEGPFTYGLDKLMSINPVNFKYKKDNGLGLNTDDSYTGVIAQELQKVIPEAVKTGPNGYLTVETDRITWASVNAIKELKDENDKLKSQNETLEWRLKSLEAKVDALMNR